MTFKRGQSGNVAGRPVGLADRRTELRKLLEPHAKELVEKLIKMALEGEANAMRLCIERLIPRIKGEAITFALPEIDFTKAGSLVSMGSILITAVTNGDVTPEQACLISTLIDAQRKAIETSELDARLSEVEHIFKLRNKMEIDNAKDKR